jgi:hypothetical protein
MKKTVKVNLVLEFDHDQKKQHEACGIDIERAEEILVKKLAKHIADDREIVVSEIVEWLARNINSDCLSFLLLHHVRKVIEGIKNEIIKQFYSN